jgi:hypothetical protein
VAVGGARACLAGSRQARYGRALRHRNVPREATVGTSDDSFRAEAPGLFGFLTDSNDDNVPVKAFGTVGYAPNVGVLGFSGVAADPEGPIQQNSYSQAAASRRSARSCLLRRRQRVRRDRASRRRRRCAHSSPASSGRPASARPSARGNSEDHALQSAGRSARPGARRSNSAKAITLVGGAAAARPLGARASRPRCRSDHRLLRDTF